MFELVAVILAIPAALLVLAGAALVSAHAKAKMSDSEMDNAIRAQLLLNAMASAERQAKAEAEALDHDFYRYYVHPNDGKAH